jgi:hypothetical protein
MFVEIAASLLNERVVSVCRRALVCENEERRLMSASLLAPRPREAFFEKYVGDYTRPPLRPGDV